VNRVEGHEIHRARWSDRGHHGGLRTGLLTLPVVVGDGARLFDVMGLPTGLELVHHRTTDTGIVINVYQPTGRAVYGSFDLPD
jgi:hypothetical protein